MARSVGTVLQNNLSRGLITEATGLNFPDNAVAETWNTVFEKIGRVTRRRGIDIESDAQALQYEDSDGVINEFLWQSVALNGGFTFLVLQVGWNVHFFELSLTAALSAGIQPDSIDLRSYKAPGAGAIENTPASFSAGAGYLFVAHPLCDPVLVRFNDQDNVFEVAPIKVLQRDFEGVPDGLGPNTNPSSLTSAHHYNLKNQGWFKNVRIGTVNNEIGSQGTGEAPTDYPLDWSEL